MHLRPDLGDRDSRRTVGVRVTSRCDDRGRREIETHAPARRRRPSPRRAAHLPAERRESLTDRGYGGPCPRPSTPGVVAT